MIALKINDYKHTVFNNFFIFNDGRFKIEPKLIIIL